MTYDEVIEHVVQVVEAAGCAVMVLGAVWALARFVLAILQRRAGDSYAELRRNLGRVILLGLEILIIADIVRTVIVDPSIDSVVVLGLIVVIRIVLSFSLEVEIDGTWPWSSGSSPARPPSPTARRRRRPAPPDVAGPRRCRRPGLRVRPPDPYPVGVSTDPETEASRRRTFAIISHPDAGKTTLTEKFLLYARRARSEAGAVQGPRAGGARPRRTGWSMEQQRGISITSTVLQFPYRDPVRQPARHPRPPRLLRGHLPGAGRRRRRGDGARRGQGHRAADAQALRGLPARAACR